MTSMRDGLDSWNRRFAEQDERDFENIEDSSSA